MLDYSEKRYAELLTALGDPVKNHSHKTGSAEHQLKLILGAVDEVKEELKQQGFRDEEEELQFFKSCMPLFLAQFIYYTEMADLESIRMVGTAKLKDEIFERTFRKMDDFFKDNAEFFKYYRSGKTNLDRHYFLRCSPANQEKTDLLTTMMDPFVCTIYSVKAATILAYSRLEPEMRRNLAEQNSDEALLLANEYKLEWTDPKVGLVELIYSLKEQGAFNHGKADLKRITRCFEHVFSIRLENTPRSFQEILTRKNGYTIYIDKLKEKLIRRIDDIEDAAMGSGK